MKQAANHRNGGRDMISRSLTELAFVTGSNEPLDIVNKVGPPEMKEQAGTDRKDTFVSEVIMSLLDESIPALRRNDGLVSSMRFPAIQGIIKKEETSGGIDERLIVSVG